MSSTNSKQAASSHTFDVEYTSEQIRQKVGSELCDARKRARLTQMQLSAASGIDQAVISRVERGRANPTLSLLQTLASPLGIRVSLVPIAANDDVDTSDDADED